MRGGRDRDQDQGVCCRDRLVQVLIVLDLLVGAILHPDREEEVMVVVVLVVLMKAGEAYQVREQVQVQVN